MKRNDTPYEEADQIELARWIDMRGVTWNHPPLGGLRDNATAAKLRRMGAQAGVPDCMIYTPPPRWPRMVGTALELKRLKGGTVSQVQREWHEKLRACHWLVLIARGLHDAIEQLEGLGY